MFGCNCCRGIVAYTLTGDLLQEPLSVGTHLLKHPGRFQWS